MGGVLQRTDSTGPSEQDKWNKKDQKPLNAYIGLSKGLHHFKTKVRTYTDSKEDAVEPKVIDMKIIILFRYQYIVINNKQQKAQGDKSNTKEFYSKSIDGVNAVL